MTLMVKNIPDMLNGFMVAMICSGKRVSDEEGCTPDELIGTHFLVRMLLFIFAVLTEIATVHPHPSCVRSRNALGPDVLGG